MIDFINKEVCCSVNQSVRNAKYVSLMVRCSSNQRKKIDVNIVCILLYFGGRNEAVLWCRGDAKFAICVGATCLLGSVAMLVLVSTDL